LASMPKVLYFFNEKFSRISIGIIILSVANRLFYF
jgi:hypothetical protein